MALTERTRIREVLFVQDDNTLVWHAHQVPITEILSGGKVVAARYGAAEALNIAGAGQVLKPAVVAIAAENAMLKERIKKLEEQLGRTTAH
jgi:hypothetical protein